MKIKRSQFFKMVFSTDLFFRAGRRQSDRERVVERRRRVVEQSGGYLRLHDLARRHLHGYAEPRGGGSVHLLLQAGGGHHGVVAARHVRLIRAGHAGHGDRTGRQSDGDR